MKPSFKLSSIYNGVLYHDALIITNSAADLEMGLLMKTYNIL